MLLDQPRQRLNRQAEFADRLQQLGRDRIALDAAMAGAFQHVGPPLQPHFARQRLADLLAHARYLDIEGVDRQQRAALDLWQKQRRRIAGKVVRAHQVSAERGGLLRRRRPAHGTAINAAATRRRSPSMML
jgi:hypothetical protein